MKLTIMLLLACFQSGTSLAQTSLVEQYNSHHFPCDEESGGTLQVNICSGDKANFADSLLNRLYRKILRSLDKEISKDNAELKRIRANNNNDKEALAYQIKNLSYNQRLKKSIINSQRQWVRSRDANMTVEQINCEGGTGCVAISNEAYIKETLERITRLESLYSGD